MKALRAKLGNPLSDLISDEVFELLHSQGFIKDTAIRDYLIRNKFVQLRFQKVGAIDAIYIIQDDYKCLQYDTIRKIVYGDKLKETGV
jgi:hypothetical protein